MKLYYVPPRWPELASDVMAQPSSFGGATTRNWHRLVHRAGFERSHLHLEPVE